MKGIYVPLSRYALDALAEMADEEFRDPRAQAALFVTDALKRSGKLEGLPNKTNPRGSSPGGSEEKAACIDQPQLQEV